MEDLSVPISLPDRKAGLQELLRSRTVLGNVVYELKMVPQEGDTQRQRELAIN